MPVNGRKSGSASPTMLESPNPAVRVSMSCTACAKLHPTCIGVSGFKTQSKVVGHMDNPSMGYSHIPYLAR